MSAILCPYCGAPSTDATTPARVPGGDSSFVCRNCGKAIEPPLRRSGVAAPPRQGAGGGNDRWSDGPPEESAKRWSTQSPLGDENSSSESVSQTSILPRGELDQPPLVRRPRSPLLWALILLTLFLTAMIGVIALARSIRPWLDARRAAAQRATVEFWWPRLDSGDDDERNQAAQAIVALGPKPLGRTLEHISKDPDDGQRFQFVPGAVRALADVGADAVPALCEALDSPEPKLRAVAVEILLQMGAPGRAARDKLLAALDDPNRWICYRTIDTLGYLGAEGAPAANRLAGFVASPDLVARRHAIEALGRIGPEARDVMGVLEKAAADDPDVTIRSSALRSLKQVDVARLARIARRDATGKMMLWLKALQDDDTPAAIAAADALGSLGFKGQPAAPGLALMLHHADRHRRLAAAKALAGLGLAAADFTLMLEAAAREEDAEVRAAAKKALEPPGGKP